MSLSTPGQLSPEQLISANKKIHRPDDGRDMRLSNLDVFAIWTVKLITVLHRVRSEVCLSFS